MASEAFIFFFSGLKSGRCCRFPSPLLQMVVMVLMMMVRWLQLEHTLKTLLIKGKCMKPLIHVFLFHLHTLSVFQVITHLNASPS